MSTAAPRSAAVTIRRAKPDDVPACGQICYEAFYKINTDHNFPPDVPDAASGVGLLTQMFSHPGFYCVVAEVDGRIAGSNCLDERDAIAGVGPITIDPSVQNRGVGRKLMEAVLDRARERNFAGVRLVQAAFHNRSLSLYTTLGFDVREPLSVMQGRPIKKTFEGFAVRKAQPSDLEACNQLALRVHGHHRGGELGDAIQQGTAMVVERVAASPDTPVRLRFSGIPLPKPIPISRRSSQRPTDSVAPEYWCHAGNRSCSAGAWGAGCAWYSP